VGFGAGVNIALRSLLDGPPVDVLLVNPDATIAPADVEELSAFLHAQENVRIGAVAPRIVDAEGQPQRVMWPFPSPSRAWLEACGLGRLSRTEDFAIGAVLLLRYEALHEVGLFDERFFLYAEETDWQRRAMEAGWATRHAHTAAALHVGAATARDEASREVLFHAGTETYVRKWFGRSGWPLYRSAVFTGALIRAAVLRGPRRRQALRRAGLYLRGPRRVAGLNR
jgi:GT2 family glycosyltransferase